VFSEVFLVQIHQNFGKYIPKFVFKAKIISENAFRNLKLGAKMEIRGGKKSHGGWDENLSIPEACMLGLISKFYLYPFNYTSLPPKHELFSTRKKVGHTSLYE
jgi:hypothetical protein